MRAAQTRFSYLRDERPARVAHRTAGLALHHGAEAEQEQRAHHRVALYTLALTRVVGGRR